MNTNHINPEDLQRHLLKIKYQSKIKQMSHSRLSNTGKNVFEANLEEKQKEREKIENEKLEKKRKKRADKKKRQKLKKNINNKNTPIETNQNVLDLANNRLDSIENYNSDSDSISS